ncbi:MAG TPA: hypothetical protein VMM38_10265 [Aridibacter sp.]|nr:hypothetical protein [Aridibacter sp.]
MDRIGRILVPRSGFDFHSRWMKNEVLGELRGHYPNNPDYPVSFCGGGRRNRVGRIQLQSSSFQVPGLKFVRA